MEWRDLEEAERDVIPDSYVKWDINNSDFQNKPEKDYIDIEEWEINDGIKKCIRHYIYTTES